MPEQKTDSVILGRGVLFWDRKERLSQRYGTVFVMPDGVTSKSPRAYMTSLIEPDIAYKWKDHYGDLIALVVQTRPSTHPGDPAREITPRTPEVGQSLILGNGTLFLEANNPAGLAVGLRPEDGRARDWLFIRSLYDAHEQIVDLVFMPDASHVGYSGKKV